MVMGKFVSGLNRLCCVGWSSCYLKVIYHVNETPHPNIHSRLGGQTQIWMKRCRRV
jgi:hypothetical protein